MLWTSTVRYTLENTNGQAETFVSLDDVTDIIISERTIDLDFGGNDEGDKFTAPIIEGYKTPYVYEATDEIGTEHYIYYEEDDISANIKSLRDSSLNQLLVLYSSDEVSIHELLEFSDIVDKNRFLPAKKLLEEWQKYHLEFNK